MGRFHVSVSKDYLGFAAAHFLTFRGHACESLHGHNYRIAVTIEGPVDPECNFVIDFAVLKGILRQQVELFDHRVLLPANNPKLAYREVGEMTLVDYLGTQTYQFPTGDCVMLPIANSTAEMIAELIATAVRHELTAAGAVIESLEVEVEESPGQSAMYSERRSERFL
ncbi:MAG: 6-pyruvoyl trahydropterin synthase family protein [Gemmatimonadales bacterium]